MLAAAKRYLNPREAHKKQTSPEAREACAAVVNDMPVACQSRGGTEPQRDSWRAATDEVEDFRK